MRPRVARRTRIIDRKGLARLLRSVINGRFEGSVAEAARRGGIPQPTLYWLVRGTTQSIADHTLGRLQRLVGPEHASAFSGCVLPPVAESQLAQYGEWIEAEMLRVLRPRSPFGKRESEDEVRRIQAELNSVRKAIKQDFPAQWNRLRNETARRGHSRARIDAAFVRIIAPLIQGTASGYIERSWAELTRSEKAACLDAGIRRELILLHRSPDRIRSQEIALAGVSNTPSFAAGSRALAASARRTQARLRLQAGTAPVGTRR